MDRSDTLAQLLSLLLFFNGFFDSRSLHGATRWILYRDNGCPLICKLQKVQNKHLEPSLID